jgi:hypothetical protein
MIRKIIQAITDRMEAYAAREDELLAVSRQFTIELHLAKCLHDHNPEMMGEIARICGEALQASEASDLVAMKDCVAKMKEFVA